VLCSSKTRAEQVVLRKRFGLQEAPFITENGGGLFLPANGPLAEAAREEARGAADGVPLTRREIPAEDPHSGGEPLLGLVLGVERPRLREGLEIISRTTGIPVRALSRMDRDEAGERLGLDPEELDLALQREFSEPFALVGESPETAEEDRLDGLGRLRSAGAPLGLTVSLGDRLFHLMGGHTKGTALERLLALWVRATGTRPWTLALGDSYNDLEMLARADEGVLVRRHDGTWARSPEPTGIRHTEGVGPTGWAEAVADRLRAGPPAS
jgi:mannosyl-3-phosphoglycerate phosphatase